MKKTLKNQNNNVTTKVKKKRKKMDPAKLFTQIVVWLILIVFIGGTFLGVILQIFAVPSYAAEIKEETAIENESVPEVPEYTFSIQEAIEYAKKNNHDLAMLKLQNSGIMYSLSESRKAVKDYEDAMDLLMLTPGASLAASSSFESYLLKSNYYVLSVKVQEEISKLNQSLQEELIDLFVENAYNAVLIKEIEYNDSLRNYEVVKKQLETGKIKFDYGNISEIEYKTLELELNNAELNVLNATKTLDDTKIDFCQKIGIDINSKLNLTTPLQIVQKEIVETKEKNDLIREKSITLRSSEKSLELAKEYYRYAKAYYGKNNATARAADVKVKTAEIELENTKIELEKSIKSTYKNIEIMKKSLELMEKRVSLMEAVLGLTNIRKTAGMATESDVIKASIDFNKAKCEYLELLSSYNMIVQMFDKNIVN